MHREEIELKPLVSDNNFNNVTYLLKYTSATKRKSKVYWTIVDYSYIFDTGVAIDETGKLDRDGIFSFIKGRITFGLYGRVIQLEYTTTDKTDHEYDVLLEIGMWFSISNINFSDISN